MRARCLPENCSFLNGTVKEFVVLHLVEDLKLLAAYVVTVCHLSKVVII